MPRKNNYHITKDKVVPFLKWAGGKRWLITQYPELFPKNFNRYIEPFLGSGAVFFHLQPQKAILSDINRDLIDTYRGIKTDWESVWNILKKYHKDHSEDYYYKIRSRNFDELKKGAARFIYLNRTCWNGLYRVNREGVFNVPIGTKTNVILNTDDFGKISRLLKGAKLLVSDFEIIVQKAEKDDFLFVDPPYTVKHDDNGFIKYNDRLFQWEDQIRLSECLLAAKKRGVKILCTNANNLLIRKLYKNNFFIKRVNRHSVIAGNSLYRGSCKELVIYT